MVSVTLYESNEALQIRHFINVPMLHSPFSFLLASNRQHMRCTNCPDDNHKHPYMNSYYK